MFCFDKIYKYKLPESSQLVSLGYSHYGRVKSPRFPPHLWLFDLCLLPPHPSKSLPRQSLFSWRSSTLLLKGWRALGCRTILPPVLWNKLCCKHAAQAVLLWNTIVCLFPSAAKSIITSLQSHQKGLLFKSKKEQCPQCVLIPMTSSFFHSSFHLKISVCHKHELILVFSFMSIFFSHS